MREHACDLRRARLREQFGVFVSLLPVDDLIQHRIGVGRALDKFGVVKFFKAWRVQWRDRALQRERKPRDLPHELRVDGAGRDERIVHGAGAAHACRDAREHGGRARACRDVPQQASAV